MDEDSIARQEQMKRQTMEYEYQLKASLKQQALEQRRMQQEAIQERSFKQMENLMSGMEKDKRET
jgi:hypothetical protein